MIWKYIDEIFRQPQLFVCVCPTPPPLFLEGIGSGNVSQAVRYLVSYTVIWYARGLQYVHRRALCQGPRCAVDAYPIRSWKPVVISAF